MNSMHPSKMLYTLKYVLNYTKNRIIYGTYNSIVARDLRFFFCCFVNYKLPKSTHLPHPTGIVIGGQDNIGENVSIYQNVTIGAKKEKDNLKFPQIGDNVVIYAGAVVLGDITVGDNAVIAANSVVIDDVPEGVVVAGAPARVIKEANK